VKRYTVELYEVHVFPVLVEADNPLEAIRRALDGAIVHQDIPDGWCSFVRLAVELGITVEELVAKFPELNKLRRSVLLASVTNREIVTAVHDIFEGEEK